MGRLVLYHYICKIVKKWVLAAVTPGGAVGWLSTGDCTNSGDVGLILDVSFVKFLSFLAGTGIVLNADYITGANTATLKYPILVPVR